MPLTISAPILLLILNLPFVGIFSRLMLPNWVLVSGILVLSVVGVCSTHATVASMLLILGICVLGWMPHKLGFDMAPLILDFALGTLMEVNLRNALAISGGDPSILFQSWISMRLPPLSLSGRGCSPAESDGGELLYLQSAVIGILPGAR
jgi:putative tricarboxylic transport membrane protein